MRCRLNDLGRRAVHRGKPREGAVLGEQKIQYRHNVFQLPRWRVRWDGAARNDSVLKSYVDLLDDNGAEIVVDTSSTLA